MALRRYEEQQKEIIITPTVLGYELDAKQNVISNYLVPSIFGCLLCIVNFACDITVAYRHFRDGNPVWASLTLLIMYLPLLGCFIVTITNWELWPDLQGCTLNNIKWVMFKILQHTFFPVWCMWSLSAEIVTRYAEKIFWSIEGVRSRNDEERNEAVNILSQPRSIELYIFLQAYLQAAPQVLLQLHILMRYIHLDMQAFTVEGQAYSIVASVAKMALVTAMYKRIRSQKIGGKTYPWYKSYKHPADTTDSVSNRRSTIIYKPRPTGSIRNSRISQIGRSSHVSQDETVLRQSQKVDIFIQPPEEALNRRRSSDYYEKPTDSFLEQLGPNVGELERETSVVGGPPRLVLRDNDITATDFNPKRLLEIKALPEDDVAGKLVSFLWWSCFLLARMLAISSFAYFYQTICLLLLLFHFILVVIVLLYDARDIEVRRSKAIFFVFIGFVYLFCLIEYKIKFKKPKFIYNVFFLLMFAENFGMVLSWWFRNMEEMNDWWFRYIFYVVLGCSILSMSSMWLYMKILKPHKVIVDTVPQK